MVNKVILIGNLGKDPEIRYFQNGDAVVNFTLATSKNWKDKDTGEKKTHTEWHNISAFRGLADICKQYLKKGDKVYIEGQIKTDSYDKDGIKHYITKIIVDEMQMLGGKQSDERDHDNAVTHHNKQHDFDDDIPF